MKALTLPTALAAAIALTTALPAYAAKKPSQIVNEAARKCVTARVCTKTPVGKAFGAATYAADRLGWELGRRESLKKHGIDPGRYPGLRRP